MVAMIAVTLPVPYAPMETPPSVPMTLLGRGHYVKVLWVGGGVNTTTTAVGPSLWGLSPSAQPNPPRHVLLVDTRGDRPQVLHELVGRLRHDEMRSKSSSVAMRRGTLFNISASRRCGPLRTWPVEKTSKVTTASPFPGNRIASA